MIWESDVINTSKLVLKFRAIYFLDNKFKRLKKKIIIKQT